MRRPGTATAVRPQQPVARAPAPARNRIVQAARNLFAKRGYAPTSIADIAAAAGVAVPTVYWAYGTKRALVSAIREAWRAEAREAERLSVVTALEDPHARLDALARFVRRQWETGADVVAIHEDARRVEPGLAEEVTKMLAERQRQLRDVVVPLEPSLRRGVPMAEAHDVLVALTSFEVYRELRARRWSGQRYEAWLGRTLRELLLGVDRPWWAATMRTQRRQEEAP